MADSDKDILITPNTGAATDPSIVFSSGATGGDDVTLFVTDDGTITTLSIEGSAGQLFSVSNDLTGVIFSVNDVSGIPSLEVNADGTVSIAEFDGDVGIGTSSPSAQLHVIADSATTNADIPVIRITSTSTGTPATGIGPSIEFESETAAGAPGNLEIGGVLALESTDVTATTEDFDFVFSTMAAGAAAAERMRITSAGNVTATSFGGITEANLLDKTATETVSGAYSFTGGATITNGLDMGSVVAASTTDLSDHLALYSTTYGINVTSGTMNFVRSTTRQMYLESTGLTVSGDVSGTTIGGITEANLLDKTAAETVSGIYTFSAAPKFTATASAADDGGTITLENSNPAISYEHTDAAADEKNTLLYSATDAFEIRLYNDAWSANTTPLQINRTGTTVDSVIVNATSFQAYGDGTAPDSHYMGVDTNDRFRFEGGTNYGLILYEDNNVSTETSSFYIGNDTVSTGKQSIFFRKGGSDWFQADNFGSSARFEFTGPLEIAGTTDHVGDTGLGTDVSSDRIQIWAKSRSLDHEPMITTGDQDLDYTFTNVNVMSYHHDQTTTSADPGAGNIRWNSLTPASVTNLYIDDLESTGRDASFMLANLADGDILSIRATWDAADYLVCSVNGTPTDNTGWWTVPVTIIHSGAGAPTTGDPIHISVEWMSQAPGGGGITGTVANDQVVVGTGASTVDSSANLTFDGSTLNVTGTVAATTVTGANVTSGADPGHTHGAGSVPNHDSLNGFVANEHIDWTVDSGSQIAVDNLSPDFNSVTPARPFVSYDRSAAAINWNDFLDQGIFNEGGGATTNAPSNGTFNPFMVLRNSSDVRVQVSWPRSNSFPIAYRGYHTAAWQTWHYTGWTTTAANANLDATFAKISGTPANNQIAVWTGTTDIEGTSTLTFDGATFSCTASTAHDFYSGAASSIARFGRNANENFRFDVTDGNSTITLDQDETDATSHQFLLNIESANTGARGFEFQDNGTMVMEIDFLNNQITTDGVDFAMTKLGSEGDTILKIEADSDNLVEASNAIVHLTQDGEAVHATFETQDAGNLIALTSGTTFAGRTTVMSWPYNSTAVTFAGSVQASSLTLTTALDEAEGGTGQTTYATGDILYASGANTLAKLAAGTNTHVLTLTGGVPTWAAPTGGGLSNIVEDTTPQLGGQLDMQTFNITGDLGGDTGATTASISLTGSGTAINAGSYANWGRNYSSAKTFMSNNTYVDSGDVVSDQHRYAVTHASYGHTIYEQAQGQHTWFGDSASVTAGNIVTKQTLMTLTEAGNLTVLGNIYPGNQTLGYIRSVTGNYGSVQVAGADGSSGSYAGISVDGKLVMMTSGTTAGIYDDTNNSWKIRCDTDGAGVALYYGSIVEFETQNSDATGNTSGAYIKDHGQVDRDVGFNDLRRVSDNPASFTVAEQHMGGVIYADDNTAFTVTLPSSTSSFPVGGVITIINANSSAVNITVADQGTYTCFYLDPGGGRTDIAASATIARGGVATIWRAETGGVASTPCFLMWGSGITP